MNTVASKRLFQEYKSLTIDPPEGITAGPVNEDDLFVWEAIIQGPEGTPFEGGVFPAELRFPKDYPLMPPTMRFLGGGIWHPNGMYMGNKEGKKNYALFSFFFREGEGCASVCVCSDREIFFISLPQWRRLHFHFTRTGR